MSTVVGFAGSVGSSYGALPGALACPAAIAVFGTTLYITTQIAVLQVSNAA